MKFRKKPIVVEAVQYNGPAMFNKFENSRPALPEGVVWVGDRQMAGTLYPAIQTLEGEMLVKAGDWIIKGIRGEFYPCKPDVFEATYEKVEE